ncbi:MAG: RNA polymerase sigma factor [Clostridia bacterium]|nr:RNA polymerase sigma factor [Clostridia bacterium]
MEDRAILDLYFARSERAIRATEEKYGRQVRGVARGILKNAADAEECAGDTWLRAWNAIPPARPNPLAAWLMRVARNLSLDRLRRARALKRGVPALALDELRDVAAKLPDEADSAAIRAAINRFLSKESAVNRAIFVRRYWYLDSIREIAGFAGRSETAVRSALTRMRRTLKRELEREWVAL